MVTEEQKIGFDNLIELFDVIRRYVIQIDMVIPWEPREDLLSHLYRFKNNLIHSYTNPDDTLTQILDSIIKGVKPLSAREEREYEVFLNRSFREYRVLSMGDIERIVGEMIVGERIVGEMRPGIMEGSYLPDDIQVVDIHGARYPKDFV